MPMMRLFSTIFTYLPLLAFCDQDISFAPNAFLGETSCSQNNKILDDGSLPLSCNTYRISTLTSNPHRCLRIVSSENNSQNRPHEEICTDAPKWSDGTNGCSAYRQNRGWCEKYGSYPEESSARMKCCVCGGGWRRKARFKKGDYVKLPKKAKKCLFKVIEIQATFESTYTLEVVSDCEAKAYGRRMGVLFAGTEADIMIEDDTNDDIIQQAFYTGISKCRAGAKDQEFWVIPKKDEDVDNKDTNEDDKGTNEMEFTIQHVITNSSIMDLSYPIKFEYVFVEDYTKFNGSEKFMYIKDQENFLASGKFGKNDFSVPEWHIKRGSDNPHEQPQNMWYLSQVVEGDSSHLDDHIQWLKDKLTDGHIEYLKQIPPWNLLDVERDASKTAVKANFRELSREFHPDKKGGALFEQVFILLQQAYDGLKNKSEYEKEKFRLESEVESQLFPHSEYVVELLPSYWTKVGNDTRAKYVIKTNSTKLDSTSTVNGTIDINNITEGQNETDAKSAQVWLLLLYSPRCSMSRVVVSFLELTANHLRSENIRVGAYGCGLYGESLEKSKKKGFIGWQDDPICKQFHRNETPNTHVVIEALGGDQAFQDSAAKFSNFYSAAARGTTKDLWPRKLINFAVASKTAWEDSEYLKYLTRDDMENPNFRSSAKVIAFVNEMEDNESHEVQQAILAALPRIARRLRDANIDVWVASCASEEEDDDSLIDCSTLNVSWLPDIKVYGVNETQVYSLIGDPLLDSRDAQIALEAMTNTIAAIFGLADEQPVEKDLEEEEEEDLEEVDSSSQSCFSMPDRPMEDQNLEKLEQNKMDSLSPPELKKQEDEKKKGLPDSEEEKKKNIGGGSPKVKLASPEKHNWQLPNRSARKASGHYGGGKIIGSGSQGNMGAISG